MAVTFNVNGQLGTLSKTAQACGETWLPSLVFFLSAVSVEKLEASFSHFKSTRKANESGTDQRVQLISAFGPTAT